MSAQTVFISGLIGSVVLRIVFRALRPPRKARQP